MFAVQERDCYIIHDLLSDLYVYDFRNDSGKGFSFFVNRDEATVFKEYPTHLENKCLHHAEQKDRSLRILYWRERVTIETEVLSPQNVICRF